MERILFVKLYRKSILNNFYKFFIKIAKKVKIKLLVSKSNINSAPRIIKKKKCYICGKFSNFVVPEELEDFTLFREAACSSCSASLRNSAVARSLVKIVTNTDYSLRKALKSIKRKNISIFEVASSGVIHEELKKIPRYFFSEYFDDVEPGHLRNGVQCENLEKLTFNDCSLDIIITEDVLEHVANYKKALKEIWRVLKPGGFFIFTIPFHEGRKTFQRVDFNGKKLAYEVYHIDPLRSEGALVFTDFGDDIIKIFREAGFKIDIEKYEEWYKKEEITKIILPDEYQEYLIKKDKPLTYFKYNNQVFISEKKV